LWSALGEVHPMMMARIADTLIGFLAWYTLWHAADFVLSLLNIK